MSTTIDEGDPIPPNCHRIEVRIRNLTQLFNSLDPSPFKAKDVDPDAELYIIESAQEVSVRLPLALVIHLSDPMAPYPEGQDVGVAIRENFARHSAYADLCLRRLIRRGWISLAIGVTFLSAMLTAAAALAPWAETVTAASIIREGLFICGWVAMWRPLEIFLFDWWPILGRRRLFNRLGHMPVRLTRPEPSANPPPGGSMGDR